MTIDPVVRLHYVTVPSPQLDAPSGDVQRLLRALEDQWGFSNPTVDSQAVPGIRAAIEGGAADVTVAVRDGRIVATRPGFHDTALGIAFDVGSTTIAGLLCDLHTGEVLASAGRMNPQIRFGEDLMSRVSHAMLHPSGGADLTAAVRGALHELAGELVDEAGVRADEVFEVVLVGNPIMHHLVFGYDVRPLGVAPFAPATDEAVEVDAGSIGLRLHPAARVYAPPCIAGHVGADTAAVILSEAPHRSAEVMLVVDVGTNAEIVLGNKDRLLAASSPTGPAFEGAEISSGMRAAPGAIERVRIDPVTLEPRFKVIGCDRWSDEEGFDAGGVGVVGICGSGIIEAIAELYLAGIVTPDGRFSTEHLGRSARLEVTDRAISYRISDSVGITQNDVRAVQLAKAALYAGIRLLMDHLGTEHIERIRLAGAFGSQIDVFYAMVLGMIPDCDLARVDGAGNAAGAGALIALLDGSSRQDIETTARTVEKVETAVEPRFQEHFVEAMAFPHGTAPYPRLGSIVDLPRRQAGAVGRRRAREKEST